MIDWPDQVVDAVARRRCVLIIGSGVSASAKTDAGKGPPTWGEFLRLALSKLHPKPAFITKAINGGQYLEACQYLKSRLGDDWLNLLRTYFLDPAYRPSKLHKALFEIDVRTIISLNFDNIYEKYAIGLSEGTFIVKKYYDDDIRQTVAGPDRYLIKMHGSMDTPSRMIFSAKDYATARIKHREFYELVKSLLHTHVCILIGCGLSDPDVRILFEDYRHSINESPHYQTMAAPIATEVSAFVRDTRGINLLPYSARDDHNELVESLVQLGVLAGERRDQIVIRRDW